MRRLGALILPVLVALATPAITAANTYTVVYDNSASWTTARANAIAMGGYLVTITSAAEQAAVEAAIAASSPVQSGAFWIGLKETASECCYVWDTAESKCFGRFYPAEPNNGFGGTETKVHMMWNITDPTRRGTWNDAPDAGSGGATDISRMGYVVETGALSNQGPCTACVPVTASSFCNQPPPGAQETTKKVSGVSTGSGIIQRTISEITEPPFGSDRAQDIQATFVVNVPVAGAGVSSVAITAAFIDSVNRAAGAGGFVANLVYPGTNNTLFWIYRVGPYTSSDVNSVPGITIESIGNPPGGGSGIGPIAGWPAQIALVLLLAAAGSWWIRSRRREA